MTRMGFRILNYSNAEEKHATKRGKITREQRYLAEIKIQGSHEKRSLQDMHKAFSLLFQESLKSKQNLLAFKKGSDCAVRL